MLKGRKLLIMFLSLNGFCHSVNREREAVFVLIMDNYIASATEMSPPYPYSMLPNN